MAVFAILAVALIASAIGVISARNPVHSVVALLANFAALAVLYLTLSGEFLAMIQIIVYSGAILILFIFVIALLGAGTSIEAPGPNRLTKLTLPALIVGALALVALGYGLLRAQIPSGGGMLGAATVLPVSRGEIPAVTITPGAEGAFGSVADFGRALFTTYLLPFELTAFVLLVAVIGVVVLAGAAVPERRRKAAEREAIAKPERPMGATR
ncbi:NADH-quinone oxidoreductase subunit J [bacterium]|nr:MAG: NADH-quinone oxidoreductase subunit J [bacterium]